MAFSAYFDASGGSGQVATVVAGYLTSVEAWERFDCDWRLVLAHDNVPYFHMREFAHFRGPFKDWRGQDGRRANFLARLVGVCKDHLHCRFSTIVLANDFSEVDQEYPLSEVLDSPYTLAARTCAGKVREWMKANQYNEPVEHIFENGDVDFDLGMFKKRFQSDGFSIPIFKPKKDEKDIWVTPFQAADFAAWEFLKAINKAEAGLVNSLGDLRKSLLNLSTIPAADGTYGKEELIRMCQRIGLPTRSEIRDRLQPNESSAKAG
jgi:hypothetical protein